MKRGTWRVTQPDVVWRTILGRGTLYVLLSVDTHMVYICLLSVGRKDSGLFKACVS